MVRLMLIAFAFGMGSSFAATPDFSKEKFNLKYDKTCESLKGTSLAKVQEVVEKGFREGLACIANLKTDQTGKHITLALKLLQDKERPFNISCEIPKNFAADDAGASTLPGETGFPTIFLKFASSSTDESVHYRHTLHEFIHTWGYRHGHDIEFPYSCEYYCFPAENKLSEVQLKDAKEAAGKICSGKFSNIHDPHYISTVVEAMKLRRKAERTWFILQHLMVPWQVTKNGTQIIMHFAESVLESDTEGLSYEILAEVERQKLIVGLGKESKEIASAIVQKAKKYRESNDSMISWAPFSKAYEPLTPVSKKLASAVVEFGQGRWQKASLLLQEVKWPESPKFNEPEIGKYFSYQKESFLAVSGWIADQVYYEAAEEFVRLDKTKKADGGIGEPARKVLNEHFDPLRNLRKEWADLLQKQEKISAQFMEKK